MKNFFIKIEQFFKSIPFYGYILSLSLFLIQTAVYMLTKIFLGREYYLQHGWVPMLPIDNYIPLVPFFSIFYYLSYPFWIFGIAFAAKYRTKEDYFDICFCFLIILLISLVVFTVKPSYMNRTTDKWIIEGYEKQGIFYDLWRIIIKNDGGDINYNLFPSFHCLCSSFTYFLVHRKKSVPLGYRIFALIMTLLIFLSVVFTKQHYFIDMIGGIGLVVIAMLLARFVKPVTRFLTWKENRKSKEQQ